MQPVAIALFWHQHQPYYPDDVSGENAMPWVRLHATKDYYGMALHIKEVPEFRCTINLVPSLLIQMQTYTERGGSDRHLNVSRLPADSLAEADACYLLDNFFMANMDNMIRPYARYHELYLKRGFGIDTAEKALGRYSERDLRDLQVWSNLTWMHPLVFELDTSMRALLEKGHSYTEDEKNFLLEKQLDILKQIVPLHRELAEGGQLELTTSPFYHPILPLLWDKRSARQAMPGCALPKYLDEYPEDAKRHVMNAVEFHKEQFGSAPIGMWPSEGSVSQEVLSIIADAGIEWIATDEEILSESTNGWISRDEQGHLRNPEMLYRPWRVEHQGRQLQMVFRDHGLSDLIGFHYQRSDPNRAAEDLVSRVESIGRAVEPKNQGRPALVPVILDGENCWEYYPDGGVQFLRSLYRSCVKNERIRPVRIGDYLREHPATDRISKLFAGSWISHNFAIWIGHHEDNSAWDLLHETREFLKRAEAEQSATPEAIKGAWTELDIAEGSDWFWWFGDSHSSAQDELFDYLFRKHLQNVYTILEAPCPTVLTRPIGRGEQRLVHSQPKSFLSVKVDGRRTYFEWINAGHYVGGSERGTMALVTEGLIKEVFFGFDVQRFVVRIDTAKRAKDDLAHIDEIRFVFLEPARTEIRVSDLGTGAPKARLLRNSRAVAKMDIEVAVDQIFEMAVPLTDLKVQPDDIVHVYVEAFHMKKSTDRAPRERGIELKVPSKDFERYMWQA